MRVVLHLEELFDRLPVYHVAVGYQYGPLKKRFDFHPKTKIPIKFNGKKKKVIELGKSSKPFHEILLFEKSLDKKYLLNKNDCRHYSKQLIDFTQTDIDIDFDVRNLVTLINLFYFK